jgi:hypothetical protein
MAELEHEADVAGVRAALGLPARVNTSGGRPGHLAMQRCEPPESMSEEEWADYMAEHHFRIVFHEGEDTAQLVSHVYKYVQVAANADPDVTGWAVVSAH